MKLILLSLLVLGGCAQTQKFLEKKIEFIAPDSAKKPLKVVKREYWQIHGAEDILRNTSEATLSVWIRQTGDQKVSQDVLGISVGDITLPSKTSRASIRIYPEGRLFAVARAGDREPEQNVMSKPVVKLNQWHHVLLTIDYAKDEIRFYLDGSAIPLKGAVNFKATQTSDTSSRSVVLGAEDDGFSNHFQGEIKDAGVWRRKLNDEEIITLAKKLKPGEKLMIGL